MQCEDLVLKWLVLSVGFWIVVMVLMGIILTAQHKAAGYQTACYGVAVWVGLISGIVLGSISGTSVGAVEQHQCVAGHHGPAESLLSVIHEFM